jgi:hypothetical protein
MLKTAICGLMVYLMMLTTANGWAAAPIKCTIADDCPGTFCEPGICV